MDTGAPKRQRAGAKRPAARSSRRSAGSRRSRKSRRKSNKMSLPRTATVKSRKSIERRRVSRAHASMSLTQLQMLAKSRGIPFGGLTHDKLIRKINNYM